jgi:phage shock protein PspC (stress-responsive transcriptional regulator)
MTNNPRPRPLYRCNDDRILGGVAAGLADYLAVDPTAVRLGFVLLALLGGLAVPVYAAAWLLIPEEGSDVSIADGLLRRDVPADPAR